MAKNDKNRRRPGMSDKLFIMRDEMAERQYNMKIAQVRKLVNEHNHADALKVLEPMKEKFSDRGEYLDLLGACLATTGAIYEAREVFTRALTTPPKSKYRDALNKYNLVRLCTLTGSPFIAYEYSQQLDCDLVAEAARRPSERYQCREMVAGVKQGIVSAAKEAKMPFDEYVAYSLLLDKARLQMDLQGPELDLEGAIVSYEEASKIKPDSTTPYNNTAIIYLWQGKLEQAVEKVRYLLEKIDSKNVSGLSNIVRMLCSLNRQKEAKTYLDRLLKIKVRPSDELVKVAEALIYFEEDQAIYKRLQPLVTNERLFSTLQIVNKAAAEQTWIFEIVAAANAGQRDTALKLATDKQGLFETHYVQFDRTYEALKNKEDGPLPGGRFIYWEPKQMYPQVAQDFTELEPLLASLPTLEEAPARYETLLRPFFEKFGEVAQNYLAYFYWIHHEPAILKAVLTQTLACGAAGTGDFVKHLAFGQVGDEQQRLIALATLVEAGLVGRQEPVNFWRRGQVETVTFAELEVPAEPIQN